MLGSRLVDELFSVSPRLIVYQHIEEIKLSDKEDLKNKMAKKGNESR